jgi:hypothetical protein
MAADKSDVERALTTHDSLDLHIVASSERMLELPVVGGWRKFPIPGDLSIPSLAKLLIIEKEINDAEGEDLERAFESARDEVMRIVRVRTPDAPDPDPDEFGVKRISAAIAWIAGDVSVAESFRSALTAGSPVPEPGEPVATAHAASDGDTTGSGSAVGEDVDPLASSEPSSTRSSGSDESTGGTQSGGETVPGERSDSTSLTPTGV